MIGGDGIPPYPETNKEPPTFIIKRQSPNFHISPELIRDGGIFDKRISGEISKAPPHPTQLRRRYIRMSFAV